MKRKQYSVYFIVFFILFSSCTNRYWLSGEKSRQETKRESEYTQRNLHFSRLEEFILFISQEMSRPIEYPPSVKEEEMKLVLTTPFTEDQLEEVFALVLESYGYFIETKKGSRSLVMKKK